MLLFKVKKNRRLRGCGRKTPYAELESELFEWIKERNKLGLRVKDRYIQAKMKLLRDNRLLNADVDESERQLLQKFGCSTMWLERFKKRFSLVSRRETSCRVLPSNFPAMCRDFIADVSKTIQEKNIRMERVINLDQVPRYIEMGAGSTLTVRGTKNVVLKKASTAHKRFTFTPAVSAGGKVVALHVLFANLKNKPTVHADVIVDVNRTGMWSMEILNTFLTAVLNRIQTCFHEPSLIILDSYGSHLKFLNEETQQKFQRRNVYFKFVPPSLTGMLQPLDVCLNRSFQKSFDDKYTEHLERALKETTNRTSKGNIRTPSYMDLSTWCFNWAEGLQDEMIQKAFISCGLVEPSLFKINDLHTPLRDCFTDVSQDEWMETHGSVLKEDALDEFVEVGQDFYKAIYNAIDGEDVSNFESWKTLMIEEVINFVSGHHEICSVFGNDEVKSIREGILTGTNIEWFAISKLLKMDIKLSEKEATTLLFKGAESTDENIHIYVQDKTYYLHISNYN